MGISRFRYYILIAVLSCSVVTVPCYLARGSGYGTHGTVGAALGYGFADTAPQAFLLGFLSHALLDFMPHHDPGWGEPLDITFHTAFNLAGLFTTNRIYEQTGRDPRAFWGAVGGILPDLEHLLFLDRCKGGNCPSKFYPSHNGIIPHHGDSPAFEGYFNELFLIGVSFSISF